MKYSSFGLIWKAYGRALCDGRESVWLRVDELLVQVVDAIDNGQAIMVGGTPAFEGARPVSLSGVVSGFNPGWNTVAPDFDRAFELACDFAGAVLDNALSEASAFEEARDEVVAALRAQPGAEVLLLDRFVPWQDTLVGAPGPVAFVVFPDVGGSWRVQVVPRVKGEFGAIKDLPKAWAALRGADLDAVTGVPGGVFCHAGRFIAGHATREGALALAQLALKS